MKVKEKTEKAGLKLNVQKTKIMASGPIASWEIDGETVETVSDFIFWGLQNHCIHNSKASILWHSTLFMVQLSHPYMTTGKTIALTRQMFVGKVMSLLFNMLSRLVITFLPRSKCLFNFMAAITI